MSQGNADAKAIFLEALDRKEPGEVLRFLDQACGADAALRARVEELLRAHRDAGNFLGRPELSEHPRATEADAAPASESPVAAALVEGSCRVIGPYKLLQQIGEGGMGAVFMAEQFQPVQRKVALKIIKVGMDSRQIIARFEAERQALAVMDHPNIAKVFDAGTTETGRPYFVMELVKGVPITQYCDQRRLSPKERLELFIPVCQAVQHAHQKGIIHRDLKPSNVLLALYDGKPVPKIIDFGIAKATGPKLTERTLFTEFGQIVGTLEYMSPEQAELNQLDIDTRSDVYSLGVLLYELLTGTTPLEKKQLQDVAVLELLRLIREVEPPKPSTRLSTTDELPSIAANRGLEPSKLSGVVRGELDWVVMKALEKDRNRRYETANGLAKDLQRYLHDEPVQACPPSAMYRLRKFARRNRVALTIASAFAFTVLLTMAGLAISTMLAVQAKGKLQQALERERRNSYFQRIALAEREWSANDLGRVEQLLDACPADLREWEWYYLRRLRLEKLSPLKHTAAVLGVAFSPDGRWIAAGGQDGFVQVWDVEGRRQFRFQAHERHVRCVAFSVNGQHLATASWDKTAKIWDFDPQRAQGNPNSLLHTLPHPDTVQSVVFSPDGQCLASAGESSVRLWDVATAQQICELPGHWAVGHCLVSSTEQQYLASPSSDNTVKIWDWSTAQERHTLRGHAAAIVSVSCSRDGRWLASSSSDGQIKVWDSQTGQEVRTLFGHGGIVYATAFSPDGKRLASGGQDETLRLWDLQTGQEVLTLRRHRGSIRSLVFSLDGKRLISAGLDKTVRIWDARPVGAEAGQERVTLTSHAGSVFGVAFSPDGRWLASIGDDGNVRVWDHKAVHAGANSPRILSGCKGCKKLTFSHNGRFLATGGGDNPRMKTLKVWVSDTWEELVALAEGEFAVAFSPDGRYLVTCISGADFCIQVREPTTGQEIRPRLRNHTWQILDLAFSPRSDGPLLASASVDATVRIWDVRAGKEIEGSPLRHTSSVRCVAFSHDGQFLASGGIDRILKVWDTHSWQMHREWPDPTGTVQSVVFHPKENRVLAWGSRDGTVKVWQTQTDEPRIFHGHRKSVEGVAFSPDGEWIASGSEDGTIKLWPARIASD